MSDADKLMTKLYNTKASIWISIQRLCLHSSCPSHRSGSQLQLWPVVVSRLIEAELVALRVTYMLRLTALNTLKF